MHASRMGGVRLGAWCKLLIKICYSTRFPVVKTAVPARAGRPGLVGKNLRTHLSTDAVDFPEDRGMNHLPRESAASREFFEHYKRDASGQRAPR